MKKFILTGILCIIIGLIFSYQDNIIEIYGNILNHFNKENVLEKNEYYRDYNFDFVKNTTDFSPKNKNDLYNIYYTVINSGTNKFTFYCNNKYKECVNDVKELANDRGLLSDINNFVHPYNSFKNIETEYNNYGKITIKISHAYTQNEIEMISNKVKNLKDELIGNNNLSDVEKIKIYHDYIINNNKYDSLRSDNGIIKYKSDIAYGPLFEGYAICGGYTDLMSIFLEDLNIKNYRLSSINHVWNALYINGNWLNLDLTWDDPVTSDSTDIIDHKFFLITTKKLQEIEKTEHQFDTNIYSELK